MTGENFPELSCNTWTAGQSENDLSRKVALIVGADAYRISILSRRFILTGARLAIQYKGYITDPACERILDSLRALGASAFLYLDDLRDPRNISRFWTLTTERFGHVDIAIDLSAPEE